MTSATAAVAARPEGNQTLRLVPLVAPVAAGGIAVLAAALLGLATSNPTLGTLAGILALAVASVVVEAYPVPVEGVPSGAVSLGAVFIVGAAVVYGWEAAVLVGFATRLLIDVLERRPPIRFLYNAGVYSLGSAGAGLAAEAVGVSDSVTALVLAVTLGGAAFYATNVVLIALVISLWAREPLVPLLKSSVYWTIIPFSIMASVSLMLAVLWERSPLLSAALIGPLVAIALYQRSVHESLKAMRLALTDPLTGLGNHRHFHERLQRGLDEAEASEDQLTVCLIDIDNFKGINDRFGHPVGDRVLAQVAAKLRQGGEAFRLGGDEFALLLPGKTDRDALTIAETVLERVAGAEYEHGNPVSVSAGIATYPRHSRERSGLVRVADNALYWSKEHGRGRAHVFRPEVEELAELRWLVEGRDRAACLRAAASLAHAVDVRDAYTGSHSYVVGELAARVATHMKLEAEQVELLRLAGSLHDLGKLAIPEEILRKPGPLTEAERLVLERHPQIGYRMLDSLGVDPVADWVLHHHERWDGTGYPDQLAQRQHSARRAHPVRGRCLRRHDDRSRVPGPSLTRACHRRARTLRGHAVRPRCRRGLQGRVRFSGRTRVGVRRDGLVAYAGAMRPLASGLVLLVVAAVVLAAGVDAIRKAFAPEPAQADARPRPIDGLTLLAGRLLWIDERCRLHTTSITSLQELESPRHVSCDARLEPSGDLARGRALSRPARSPSGRLVADVARRQVVITKDGRLLRIPLAGVRALAWSPDERWLAAAGQARVYLVRVLDRDLRIRSCRWPRRSSPGSAARELRQSGMLPCLRAGLGSRFERATWSASQSTALVRRGSMTSST